MKIKITKLDKLFSDYIRARDKFCQKCGRSGSLQTSHFHGRRKKSTRWDELNCVALCFTCHRHFTENPLEHCEWFKNHMGEDEFYHLNVRAQMIDRPLIEPMELYYKKKLEELRD